VLNDGSGKLSPAHALLVVCSRKNPFMNRADISPSRRHLLFGFLVALIVVPGCNKTSLSKSMQRAITNEIVAAAQKNADPKSEVTVRSGVTSFEDVLHGEPTVDNVYVTVPDPSRALALQRALAEIARRRKMSIVERSSADVERFDLAFHGTHTHTVRVVTPLAARSRAAKPHGAAAPRLAIIIDDLGNDRGAGDAVISLPFPLTVSVLPKLPFSAELSEEAYRRGDQVLLHLPMQAQSATMPPEQAELRVGMSAEQVRSTFAGMLETVPHVVGVNNHEGSLATSDPALMEALMPALRERGLFFIDSRTTAATVAYDEAERAGLAAASRKVFLDDRPQRDAIRAQLQTAASDAVRDGSAIAIGHPHPETIAALAETVPALEARGIRMVFASDLVH
jgi:polysaccharide deacetylase 2 family uncharacterized protein YibQ